MTHLNPLLKIKRNDENYTRIQISETHVMLNLYPHEQHRYVAAGVNA